MSYSKIETYRGWGIHQNNGLPDYIGNMKLEQEKKGVDLPDLKADIDEAMISELAAFESKFMSGPSPSPTPTGLTTAQKTYCRGRVTYMRGHLDKLDASAINAPTVSVESQKVRADLVALDTAIVKDPITMPSGRPLGLARYNRRR
jgi:hypothetical protein